MITPNALIQHYQTINKQYLELRGRHKKLELEVKLYSLKYYEKGYKKIGDYNESIVVSKKKEYEDAVEEVVFEEAGKSTEYLQEKKVDVAEFISQEQKALKKKEITKKSSTFL